MFQVLVHTAGVEMATLRILAKAHSERNLAEYQGGGTVNERLLLGLIDAVETVEAKVSALIKQ